MSSRSVIALSVTGAVLLLSVAALHASGYSYVSGTLQASELPDFFKKVLPVLFMYPSALMAILAFAALVSLKLRAGRAAVLGLICAIIAVNAVLGFVLGGLAPGGVLLIAAVIFGVAARLSSLAT